METRKAVAWIVSSALVAVSGTVAAGAVTGVLDAGGRRTPSSPAEVVAPAPPQTIVEYQDVHDLPPVEATPFVEPELAADPTQASSAPLPRVRPPVASSAASDGAETAPSVVAPEPAEPDVPTATTPERATPTPTTPTTRARVDDDGDEESEDVEEEAEDEEEEEEHHEPENVVEPEDSEDDG